MMSAEEQILDTTRVKVGETIQALLNRITGHSCGYLVIWVEAGRLGAKPECCTNLVTDDVLAVLEAARIEFESDTPSLVLGPPGLDS